MQTAIRIGESLQSYPLANMDPMNANPIHVPSGPEITIIDNQNDLVLRGKYASTNRGP